MQGPPGSGYSLPYGAPGPGPSRIAHSGRRRAGGIILLLSLVILAVSLLLPWWFLSASEGSTTVGYDFLPGNTISATLDGSTISGSYSAAGFGGMAGLYEALFGLLVAGLALAGIAGVLGLLTDFGVLRGRTRGRALPALAIVGLLLVVAAVGVTTTAQPSTFNNANPDGLCSAFANYSGSSPCSSFWGSISANGATISWGAGTGWYIGVVGLVFVLAGVLVWNSGRKDPWEEYLMPQGEASYGALGAYAAAPGGFAAGPGPGGYSGGPAPAFGAGFAPPVAPGGSPGMPSPAAPPLASEVLLYRIYVMKQRLDNGEIDVDTFARGKAQLFAQPGTPRAPGASAPTQQNMVKLEWLTEHGAVTSTEQTELRRRIVMGL
jgi:hypothetical protein